MGRFYILSGSHNENDELEEKANFFIDNYRPIFEIVEEDLLFVYPIYKKTRSKYLENGKIGIFPAHHNIKKLIDRNFPKEIYDRRNNRLIKINSQKYTYTFSEEGLILLKPFYKGKTLEIILHKKPMDSGRIIKEFNR